MSLHSDVKYAIEQSFKQLVLDTPYPKVTVTQICDRANVSRKTFYSYFDDKEAIVASLFEEHVIQPFRNLDTAVGFLDDDQKMLLKNEQLYQSVYAEKDYYYALVSPIRGNDDTFIRVVTWKLYDFNMESFTRNGIVLNDVERDYIAYFFASSQAMLLQKWISDKMVISPHDLSRLYMSLTSNYWQTYID